MRILTPRSDFVIVEDYFSATQAAEWLDWVLKKGKDPVRGFQHPDLRPNRFHKSPKYPVKKYMCLGLYWSPLDYNYSPYLFSEEVKPFPISNTLKELVQRILEEYYPWKDYSPETVLVNYYTKDSSMGLHVDKDEEDKISPIIGLNFGSTCRFLYEDEQGEMREVKIPGNSVYIFGHKARLMRHGLGSIYSKTLSPGSETYLDNKERINLTIRQVYSQK
jgi:alkylated DNA repair dioxygenase AlkB